MPRSIAVSIPAITAVLSAFCAPAPELIVYRGWSIKTKINEAINYF